MRLQRFIPTLLLLSIVLLLLPLSCIAEGYLDQRYASILNAWNAANGQELFQHIQDEILRETNGEWIQDRVTIRLGGNTQELLEDDTWDLAIVSSLEVNLQMLVDNNRIMSSGYSPYSGLVREHRQYPQAVQELLPQHPFLEYRVYCYDIDEQTNDATLLICHAYRENKTNCSDLYAQVILNRRTPEQIRALEGVVYVDWTEGWNEEKLLSQPEDWDIANLSIASYEELNALDQAGLLADFSADPYWASRSKAWAAPNGVFSEDQRMIAVPYTPYFAGIYPHPHQVLLLNAMSPQLEAARAYAAYWMKSYEWMYDRVLLEDTPDELRRYGICTYRDQVDW